MAKEIQFGEDVRRKLEAGVDKHCEYSKSNSRTEGRNVLLDRSFGAPLITIDGM